MNNLPVFFIDHSALKDMFEGKEAGDKLVRKFYDLKNRGLEIKAITSMSCFLRAIYLTDPNTNINSIQKTLSFLKIIPSSSNFTIEREVIDEVLKLAQNLSK